MTTPSFAVLTISDRSSRGEREDLSGPALVEFILARGWQVKYTAVIPDEKEWIKRELLMHSDDPSIHVILTTGGTGLTHRDVTPEATLEVGEAVIPGITEFIRMKSSEKTMHALLSRAVCVQRNRCIILNVPGSPRGAVESLSLVADILPHAIAQLRDLENSQDHTVHHQRQGDHK
jgi:molybdenum cofactor synthesis domain-containing protein